MKPTTSAEDYKLLCQFQAVREKLLAHESVERLEQPLAFWALPSDRRLPLALLSRRIGELLDSPYEELAATPGIGKKKMGTLIKLLLRACNEEVATPTDGLEELEEYSDEQIAKISGDDEEFDHTMVSEIMWNQWCETVRRFDLGPERLGRLAPTLQALPTVIWKRTLDTYLDLSVGEIRELKTHGEKRVRVVLEVIYTIHKMLSNVVRNEFLHIRLVPRLIAETETWIQQTLESDEPITADVLRQGLVPPLLDQVKIDAGDTVFELASGRVGADGISHSVRQQSRSLDVTRARVYQLLDECSRVMEVRWPEGRNLLGNLLTKLEEDGADEELVLYFRKISELFFPEKNNEMESTAMV